MQRSITAGGSFTLLSWLVVASRAANLLESYLNAEAILGPAGPRCSCAWIEPASLARKCGAPASFMSLVETHLQADCDLLDPTRCYDPFEAVWDEADFVVIGAGTAGSIVAGNLAEGGHRVLVLEAGGAAPSGTMVPSTYFAYRNDPDVDWAYRLERQTNVCLDNGGVCVYPRGKVVGGTGMLNGMMYMRGRTYDWDSLAQDGIEGWSWKDVFPYFLKSENNSEAAHLFGLSGNHTVGGKLNVERFRHRPEFAANLLEAYRELGFPVDVDLNSDRMNQGFSVAQATTRNGIRLSTAEAYMLPLVRARSPNLSVVPGARVVRINVDKWTGLADSVVYSLGGVVRVAKARKEVVLSAGTIASPQVLMLSGIGPRQHLEALGIPVVRDSPHVGRHLGNHLSVELFFSIGALKDRNELNVEALRDFLQARRGPMTSTGLSQLTGFVNSDYPASGLDALPDLQIFHAGFLANCSRTGSPKECSKCSLKGFSLSPTVLGCKSEGSVKLRSADPFADPVISGRIMSDRRDGETLLKGIRFAQRVATTKAMRRLKVTMDKMWTRGCQQYFHDTDQYWMCVIKHRTNPENHQVGTCRMGVEGDGVVGADLRVMGTRNLRVVDASVIRRPTTGNVMAPIIMVAEKASDIILASWHR